VISAWRICALHEHFMLHLSDHSGTVPGDSGGSMWWTDQHHVECVWVWVNGWMGKWMDTCVGGDQ
jgi:hypothetical protein